VTIVEQARRQIERELQATRTEIERLDERLKLKGDYGLGRGDSTVYLWERNLARRDRAQDKLKKLKAALQRIEKVHTGYVRPAVRLDSPTAWRHSLLLAYVSPARSREHRHG
jgi:DNA repair exonuclease SbcCD ATPase subunit